MAYQGDGGSSKWNPPSYSGSRGHEGERNKTERDSQNTSNAIMNTFYFTPVIID